MLMFNLLVISFSFWYW